MTWWTFFPFAFTDLLAFIEVIAAVLLDPDGDAAGRMDAQQGGKEWSTSTVPVHANSCLKEHSWTHEATFLYELVPRCVESGSNSCTALDCHHTIPQRLWTFWCMPRYGFYDGEACPVGAVLTVQWRWHWDVLPASWSWRCEANAAKALAPLWWPSQTAKTRQGQSQIVSKHWKHMKAQSRSTWSLDSQRSDQFGRKIQTCGGLATKGHGVL